MDKKKLNKLLKIKKDFDEPIVFATLLGVSFIVFSPALFHDNKLWIGLSCLILGALKVGLGVFYYKKVYNPADKEINKFSEELDECIKNSDFALKKKDSNNLEIVFHLKNFFICVKKQNDQVQTRPMDLNGSFIPEDAFSKEIYDMVKFKIRNIEEIEQQQNLNTFFNNLSSLVKKDESSIDEIEIKKESKKCNLMQK